MKIGFYYHITLYKKNDKLNIPSYLGVFLDSLAKGVELLIIFGHEASEAEKPQCDYTLTELNIKWVNLGFKTPFWHRMIFASKILRTIESELSLCDCTIIRAPSPLAPFFSSKYGKRYKIAYLMVGDYMEGLKAQKDPLYRKIPVYLLTYWNEIMQNRAISNSLTFVNSSLLFKKYKGIARQIHQVKTTTLTESDFFEREDSFNANSNQINILFSGRISISKGVLDLIAVIVRLIENNYNARLHIVGWEDDKDKPVEKEIEAIAIKFGITNAVIFHGKKRVGPELFQMYRESQMYVLPSQSNFEGFPRTLWEAMANSLPIVTTSVGSIPFYLLNGKHALIVPPKNTEALLDAITALINNEDLRKSLIKNSFILSKEVTLEKQTSLLLKVLNNYSNE